MLLWAGAEDMADCSPLTRPLSQPRTTSSAPSHSLSHTQRSYTQSYIVTHTLTNHSFPKTHKISAQLSPHTHLPWWSCREAYTPPLINHEQAHQPHHRLPDASAGSRSGAWLLDCWLTPSMTAERAGKVNNENRSEIDEAQH